VVNQRLMRCQSIKGMYSYAAISFRSSTTSS
jgi:hypothetical protein